MKNLKSKLGFTLIELLVVITIIGILATGAVAVFTSQIQKARDSTRLTDTNALKSGIEQFYQDQDQYPDSSNTSTLAFSGVEIYVPKLPTDPKSGQARTWAAFDYVYSVGPDLNLIPWQVYEISTTFEQQWNVDKKAADSEDNWNDDNRLELWISMDTLNTDVTGKVTANSLLCVVQAWGGAVACNAAWSRLVIKGN